MAIPAQQARIRQLAPRLQLHKVFLSIRENGFFEPLVLGQAAFFCGKTLQSRVGEI